MVDEHGDQDVNFYSRDPYDGLLLCAYDQNGHSPESKGFNGEVVEFFLH